MQIPELEWKVYGYAYAPGVSLELWLVQDMTGETRSANIAAEGYLPLIFDSAVWCPSDKIHEFIFEHLDPEIFAGASFPYYQNGDPLEVEEDYIIDRVWPDGGGYAAGQTRPNMDREIDGEMVTPGIYSLFRASYAPKQGLRSIPALARGLTDPHDTGFVTSEGDMILATYPTLTSANYGLFSWTSYHLYDPPGRHTQYWEIVPLALPWMAEMSQSEFEAIWCITENYSHYLTSISGNVYPYQERMTTKVRYACASWQDGVDAYRAMCAPQTTNLYGVSVSSRVLMPVTWDLYCNPPLFKSPVSGGCGPGPSNSTVCNLWMPITRFGDAGIVFTLKRRGTTGMIPVLTAVGLLGLLMFGNAPTVSKPTKRRPDHEQQRKPCQ